MEASSATAAPHVIFLTGAPDAASLSWNEADLTAGPTFSDEPAADTSSPTPGADAPAPAWRVLPLAPARLHTGLTPLDPSDARQPWDPALPRDEAAFLNTQCLSFLSGSLTGPSHPEDSSSAVADFLEQSFTTHEKGTGTQVDPAATAPDDSATSFSTSTNDTSALELPASTAPPTPAAPVPRARDLTDLRAVPNAAYLRGLGIATKTVGLVVGIVDIAPARTVRTRRGNVMELVELTVGDETKAGFGINLWLPPPPPPPPPPDSQRRSVQDPAQGRSPRKPGRLDSTLLRASLARVRRRDVVMFRNVALGQYLGNVYGQSLCRDVTKLDLLCRLGPQGRRGERGLYCVQDLERDGAGDVQLQKTKRVREWVLNFVPH